MLVMPFRIGKTDADIREILSKAAASEEGRAVAEIIAGHRGTHAPAALDIGRGDARLAHLLAVAGDAAFGRVDALSGNRLTAVDGGKRSAGVGVGDGSQAAETEHGIGDHPVPGGKEDQKNATEECGKPVHVTSVGSW